MRGDNAGERGERETRGAEAPKGFVDKRAHVGIEREDARAGVRVSGRIFGYDGGAPRALARKGFLSPIGSVSTTACREREREREHTITHADAFVQRGGGLGSRQ